MILRIGLSSINNGKVGTVQCSFYQIFATFNFTQEEHHADITHWEHKAIRAWDTIVSMVNCGIKGPPGLAEAGSPGPMLPVCMTIHK